MDQHWYLLKNIFLFLYVGFLGGLQAPNWCISTINRCVVGILTLTPIKPSPFPNPTLTLNPHSNGPALTVIWYGFLGHISLHCGTNLVCRPEFDTYALQKNIRGDSSSLRPAGWSVFKWKINLLSACKSLVLYYHLCDSKKNLLKYTKSECWDRMSGFMDMTSNRYLYILAPYSAFVFNNLSFNRPDGFVYILKSTWA